MVNATRSNLQGTSHNLWLLRYLPAAATSRRCFAGVRVEDAGTMLPSLRVRTSTKTIRPRSRQTRSISPSRQRQLVSRMRYPFSVRNIRAVCSPQRPEAIFGATG